MLTYFYEFLSGLKEFELVTKNGRMFDVPFLVWRSILWNKEEEAKQLLMLDHFDLHDLTKKWVGLDDMARLLKVEGKKGNGLDAIGLFRTKNYDKLIDYCYHDVQVTEQIYKRYKSLPYISAEGESIGE
jgi:predicted PolB exonuclease-like 3'-5' exonuclease